MNCKFQKIGEGVLWCDVCQRRHFGPAAPEKVSRKCQPGRDTGGVGGLRLVLKMPERKKTAAQKDREAAATMDWPSLVESTKLFLGSMGQAVNSMAQGKKVFVSPERYTERTTTCDGCPFRSDRRCKVCTCNIPAKAKLESSHCPLAKWAGDPGVDVELCQRRGVPQEAIDRHQAEWERTNQPSS
jgi:hypothetical protein